MTEVSYLTFHKGGLTIIKKFTKHLKWSLRQTRTRKEYPSKLMLKSDQRTTST